MSWKYWGRALSALGERAPPDGGGGADALGGWGATGRVEHSDEPSDEARGSQEPGARVDRTAGGGERLLDGGRVLDGGR
eukprot:2675326-Prymnesium_polylepis.1